jgi:hypothetical protein
MSTNRSMTIDRFDFRGAIELVNSGSVSPIPWRRTIVGAAPPTIGGTADGMTAAFTSTSEAQSLRLSFADVLSYDIDDLIYFETLVRITSATLTNVSAIIGMASAGNAVINTIGEQASFGINGSLALFCETDDGTRDNDDIATGLTLTTGAWTRLRIDFATGTTTVSPGPSLGGKSNIQFYAGTATSSANIPMRRVALGTRFDMSAYSGGLQPYVQFQKASSTDVGSLSVKYIEVGCRDF